MAMSAEPAIELPVPDEPVPFNLELSEDQRDIRDWVHGFAADVVRPTPVSLSTNNLHHPYSPCNSCLPQVVQAVLSLHTPSR